MKERNYLNVKFVRKVFLQRITQRTTWKRFMKKRKHSDVNFVTKVFLGSIVHIKNHIESVHEEKKTLKCRTCDRSFTQKRNVTSHMQSVHGNKTFKCKTCKKSFSRKSTLNVHIKSVHEKKCFT